MSASTLSAYVSAPQTSARKLLWPSSTAYPFTDVPSWVEQTVRRAAPQLSVVVSRSEEEFLRELPDAEILLSWKITPEQFALCKKLRWIHSPAAGVNELIHPALARSGVLVTNGSTVHAVPVAEQTMALLLAIVRRLPESFRFQLQEKWGRVESWAPGRIPAELCEKTLGIIGFGRIGREVAARAQAFKMRVLAVKRDPTRGVELAHRVFAPPQMPELLRASDFVVIAAPETAETKHLIGAPQLQEMKPTSYLLNVSRGTLVDHDALLAALNSGALAGAALDVTDPEPLPPGHPLWKHPNVIITPHLGGATDRYWQRELDLLCDNLRRYLAGEPLLNVVDTQRGY